MASSNCLSGQTAVISIPDDSSKTVWHAISNQLLNDIVQVLGSVFLRKKRIGPCFFHTLHHLGAVVD